jgi:hypothetical protein
MLNVINLSVIMFSVVAPQVEIIMAKIHQRGMCDIRNKNEQDGMGWSKIEW